MSRFLTMLNHRLGQSICVYNVLPGFHVHGQYGLVLRGTSPSGFLFFLAFLGRNSYAKGMSQCLPRAVKFSTYKQKEGRCRQIQLVLGRLG
jgi:hypothetical protein